jgi:hypothetical protein
MLQINTSRTRFHKTSFEGNLPLAAGAEKKGGIYMRNSAI